MRAWLMPRSQLIRAARSWSRVRRRAGVILGSIDTADRDDVEAHRRAFDAKVEALHVDGDPAQEARNTRYAGRVHLTLDGVESEPLKHAKAQEMFDEARDDPAKLSVLLEEIPARLPTAAAWMPAKVKQINSELGTAAEGLAQALQRSALTQFAVSATRRGLQSGMPVNKAVLDGLKPAIERLQG
jgi:hypothetical protein